MMALPKTVLTVPLVFALLCSTGWTIDTPGNSSTSADHAGNHRERHWSGTLVDIGCMNTSLGPAAVREAASAPSLPMAHLSGWGAILPQPSPAEQHPPDGNTLGPTQQGALLPAQDGTQPQPAPRGVVPDPATMAPLPDPSGGQSQERANVVNRAAKHCGVSTASATVGIATGEGQILKFDQAGATKARQALRTADPQLKPGKKIKVKVSGMLADASTIAVASIEIKGMGSLLSEFSPCPAISGPPHLALLPLGVTAARTLAGKVEVG